MDRLEEFIRKNREELDKYIPSPDIWKTIRKNLHKSRPEMIRWLSAAAMIMVILTTAVLFYVGKNREYYDAATRLMRTNPELFESEFYYNNLINDLFSKATPLLTGHPDIEKELSNDLSQLDSICTDIKKDLRDNIDNQDVVEALINNYRIKIRILEDMLDNLKQNENSPKKPGNHAI